MIGKLRVLVLVLAVLIGGNQAWAEFYVIAGGGKPVGTKITSVPYTISNPGFYFFTGNLTYNSTSGNAITVSADNVTLDLMGFTLTGPAPTPGGYGIFILDSRDNVEIRNGTVSGWWGGVIMGPEGTGTGNGHRIIGVRAVGNANGIFLGGTGIDHLIKGCTAFPASFGSQYGLNIMGKGTIQGCTVMNFSRYGISIGGGGTISDNVVRNCTGVIAVGIRANGNVTVSHNSVINCTTGIFNEGGGSIVGNAVLSNTGQTGIAPATNITPSATPTLLDQNSVNGEGTHYGPGNIATVKGLNGG